MTTRRQTLLALGSVAARPWSGAAVNGPLICILSPFHTRGRDDAEPFRRFARELGYAGVDALRFEVRSAEGSDARLPGLAAELVALRPAVIVTWGDAGARAVLAVSKRIPVVVMTEDLLGAGLVASLNKPGASVTGVSVMATELDVKRLQILAELLPRRSTVLLLGDKASAPSSRPALMVAAQTLGLGLTEASIAAAEDIEEVLGSAKARGVAGVNVLASPLLYDQSALLVDLAARYKLPAIFEWSMTAEAGGLIGYGPDIEALFLQFVGQVVRVLKGASAGDLPVEQPSKFTLAINLKTARALGLTIPPDLLLRADRVIQ